MMDEQGDKRMADSLIFGEKTGPGGLWSGGKSRHADCVQLDNTNPPVLSTPPFFVSRAL
jgi:hypothetical protein